MKTDVTYSARMKFKYNGQLYRKGDQWEPCGERPEFDEILIKDGRYVMRHETPLEAVLNPTRCTASNKNGSRCKRSATEEGGLCHIHARAAGA